MPFVPNVAIARHISAKCRRQIILFCKNIINYIGTHLKRAFYFRCRTLSVCATVIGIGYQLAIFVEI